MAHPRHLRNAPITEALIDLRVIAPKDFSAHAFDSLKPRLAASYPVALERRGIEARFEFAPSKVTASRPTDLGLQGLFFKSADDLTIAQFRTDGFTLNRLKPYTSWKQIFPEAMRLWKMYVDVVRPTSVSRLALRYINHLKLSPPVGEFKQFLTAPPEVPDGLPQGVSSFLNRVVIHEGTTGTAATITQAFEQGLEVGSATIIFDIDAFKGDDFRPDSPDIEEVFGQLHDFKNSIFFSSLTDTLLQQYE